MIKNSGVTLKVLIIKYLPTDGVLTAKKWKSDVEIRVISTTRVVLCL